MKRTIWICTIAGIGFGVAIVTALWALSIYNAPDEYDASRLTEDTSSSWARTGDALHVPLCTSALGLNYVRCTPDGCDIVTLSTADSGRYEFPQIAIDEHGNIFIYAIKTFNGISDLEAWYLPSDCYDDYDNVASWNRYTDVDGEF